MKKLLFGYFFLFYSVVGVAQPELSELNQVRYYALIEELRCLVCQNQNLAESNAPLAEDLKTQVAEMLNEGRSDSEIKEYLITRYGDFVLYRPPFKPLTWLLWIGPFVLLGFGLFTAWRLFSASPAEQEQLIDDADVQKLIGKSDGSDADTQQENS